MQRVISNRVVCREMIRMGPQEFHGLCSILQREGGLRPTQRVSIEEQVVKLYIRWDITLQHAKYTKYLVDLESV